MISSKKFTRFLSKNWIPICVLLLATALAAIIIPNYWLTDPEPLCNLGDAKCVGDQIQNEVIQPLVSKLNEAGSTLDKASSTFVQDVQKLSSTFERVPQQMQNIGNQITNTSNTVLGNLTTFGKDIQTSLDTMLDSIQGIPDLFEKKLRNFQLTNIINSNNQ